jgi:hypothetical protein
LRRCLSGIKGEQLTPSPRPAHRARAAAAPATWRTRVLPAYGSLDNFVVDRGPPWGLRLAFLPYTAPRPRPHRAGPRARARTRTRQPSRMQGQLAMPCRPPLGAPYLVRVVSQARSAKNREVAARRRPCCAATVLQWPSSPPSSPQLEFRRQATSLPPSVPPGSTSVAGTLILRRGRRNAELRRALFLRAVVEARRRLPGRISSSNRRR